MIWIVKMGLHAKNSYQDIQIYVDNVYLNISVISVVNFRILTKIKVINV